MEIINKITPNKKERDEVTKVINDLCTKGYSALLEGENFSEGHASVHPS